MQLDEEPPKITDVTHDQRVMRRRLKLAFALLLLAMAMSWALPALKPDMKKFTTEPPPVVSEDMVEAPVETIPEPEPQPETAMEETPPVAEASAPAEDRRIAQLQEQVETLMKRLESVEAKPIAPDATAEIGALKMQLAQLEQKAQGDARSGQRMVASWLALQDLGQEVRSGRPYAAEWKRMQLRANEAMQPPMQVLSQWQAQGAPTLAKLQARFESEIASGVPVSDDITAMGQMKQKLKTLVRIRRVDEQAKGDDALLTEAAQALARGDVAMAREAVRKLPLGWRAITSAWIQEAGNYLEAEAAIAALQHSMAELAEAATEQAP